MLNFSSVTGDLALTDITITGGRTSGNNVSTQGPFARYSGGGIRFVSSGVLSLSDSVVSGNSTAGERAEGGGVFANSGSVVLGNSEVSSNSTTGSTAEGGGIYSRSGSLTLVDSTVSENSTTGNNSGGAGFFARNGSVTLYNSTVSGNTAAGAFSFGGGISVTYGALTISNSTVSRNSTEGYGATGGGILAPVGDVTLINSTVSGNSTASESADGGGIALGRGTLTLSNSTVGRNSSGGIGGGVFTFDDSFNRSITIENSIVADNLQNLTLNASGSPNDLVLNTEGVLTINHSLIGVADNVTQPISGNIGNQLGTAVSPLDPVLGPLAFNGGLTRTHALLPGSPAIDAGSNALAVDEDGDSLLTDQRGDGFDRIVSGTVDIGAFEFNANALPVPPAIVSTVRDEGGVLERPDLLTTYSVTFDADVNVEASDLTIVNELLSTENVDPSAVAFTYDQATQTATWDFTALTLDAAFYSFELSDEIVSATGNVGLDGDGDGNAGGNFVESVYVALPGDANLDGQVDVLDDAFALVANLGLTGGATWAQGDFNDDGVVDILGDAFILVGNLGRSVAPPVSTGSVATLAAARSAESASSTQQVVLIDDTQTTSLFEKADAETTSRLSIATGPNSLAGSIDAAFEDQGLLGGELVV